MNLPIKLTDIVHRSGILAGKRSSGKRSSGKRSSGKRSSGKSCYACMLLLLPFGVTGQEVADSVASLYLKNGSILEISVLETGQDRIRFYKTGHLPGPVFSLPYSRVDSLVFPGSAVKFFESGEPKTALIPFKNEIQSVPSPELLLAYKQWLGRYQRNKVLSGVTIPVGMFGLLTGFTWAYATIFSPDYAVNLFKLMLPVGVVATGTGIVLTRKRKKQRSKAMAIRQELEYRGIDPVHIRFSPTD